MPDSFAKTIMPFIDLTSLNDDDDATNIDCLCDKASNALGEVAAVCVYPKFIKQVAKRVSDKNIKIATVVNFPDGNESFLQTQTDIGTAIEAGADELDVVFPYEAYLDGDKEYAFTFLNGCRQSAKDKVLKVILETGALISKDNIIDASVIAIECGADFLKTSTGKIKTGATISAATAMLTAINTAQSNHSVGLKVSGGIRTPEDALAYYELVNQTMGKGWATPATFRIGASSLLDKLLATSG